MTAIVKSPAIDVGMILGKEMKLPVDHYRFGGKTK